VLAAPHPPQGGQRRLEGSAELLGGLASCFFG
jgi:hypothetical protein